jgi:hypothetical protein
MPRFGGNARADGRRTRALAGLALACAAWLPRSASAFELGQEDSAASVEVHGFASQGFILTLKNDYLAANTTDGSFEFSEVGINFTKSLTDTLRLGVQLFAQDLGPYGNWNAQFDWFYLDYRWQDWLGFRAGRLKIPFGFHNEVQDIDAARVPVLLPQSVYPLQNRNFLFSHTGAELYGFARHAELGALEYRLFGGTIFLDGDALTPPGTPLELDFHVPYVLGGRLIWETPLEGLRIGGSFEAVRLEITAFIPGAPTESIENDSKAWVASAEYSVSDLVLTAEYSRWYAKQATSNPALTVDPDVESERAYVMATYRLTPWLHPGAYYSIFFPDVDNREDRENIQHDVAATLRFDINSHWLVKLEGHYMAGTAGLTNPISVNAPSIADEDAYWAAFFVKTTAHF